MATNLPIKEVDIEKMLQLEKVEDEKTRENILHTAVKLIDLKTLNKVLEDLDKDERQELADIMEEQEPQKVIDYIEGKGMNFTSIVKEQTKTVRKKISEVKDSYNPEF